MRDRLIKLLLVLNLLFLTGLLIRPLVFQPSASAQSTKLELKDNAELARMMDEDQADRTPVGGKPFALDLKVVAARDEARLKRVKEIYQQGLLATGNDYFNAALILQHGKTPEDYLLAHELAVVAISKKRGLDSMAAVSEDRFLMSIGRPQRFGTQYRRDEPTDTYRLYTVGEGVTDKLRRLMNVPTLAEAKAREAEMNRKK